MQMPGLAALGLVLFLGACSDAKPVADPDELMCTAEGALDGVGVTIPVELWVPSGTIAFKVCDEDGCVDAKRRLRPFPKDGPGPDERLAVANIENFGGRFHAGKAKMTADVYGPDGRLVATRTQTIKLHRSWPNGKACDGAGMLGGGFDMNPTDRV